MYIGNSAGRAGVDGVAKPASYTGNDAGRKQFVACI